MLEFILINSLVIWGIFAATRDGMIFNLESLPLPNWLSYPLYECPVCMSSVWGSVGFYMMGDNIWLMPIWILAIAGLNYLILMLILNENS
jgi:hypothetical protein